jgi:mono/diheme cytochrome c family protein
MDSQPRFKAQTTSVLFRDGRSNRSVIPGTVARGQLGENRRLVTGRDGAEWSREFPDSIPLNDETMRRGQQRYNIYCAQCHGLAGDGDGLTAQRALLRGEPDWVPPVQLYASSVQAQPVGQIYNSIANGIRKMPSYGKQISVEDRWAIVFYVQALQRSQSATVEDIPENLREKVQ